MKEKSFIPFLKHTVRCWIDYWKNKKSMKNNRSRDAYVFEMTKLINNQLIWKAYSSGIYYIAKLVCYIFDAVNKILMISQERKLMKFTPDSLRGLTNFEGIEKSRNGSLWYLCFFILVQPLLSFNNLNDILIQSFNSLKWRLQLNWIDDVYFHFPI